MPLLSPLVMVFLATGLVSEPVPGRCAEALPIPSAPPPAPTVPMPEVRPRPVAVRMPNACAVASRPPAGRTFVPGRAVVVSSPNLPLEIAEP